MQSNINTEKVKNTISTMIENISRESDSKLFGEYFNLYKKEISLFNRTKAGAYLLYLYDQGKRLNLSKEKNNAEKQDVKTENNRHSLEQEDSVKLFLGIGRNRKVFPREILGLLNSKAAIPKEDIGAIRIMENYSFLQVRKSVAEKIIEALNGTIFRGKQLTVNYAKPRKEEEPQE